MDKARIKRNKGKCKTTNERVMTIKKAIQIIWQELPENFKGFTFYLMVKSKMQQYEKYPYDGTIARRMRELRDDNIINYRVTDNNKSMYQKIDVL